MTTKIVQIVPRLPPHTDGVGDYALKLAHQLLKKYQIKTHFLVFQLGIEIEATIEGFSVTSLPSHDSQAFLSVLPNEISGIILQYSNYPYLQGKLDAPFWLADALQLAIERRHLKIVVMFHELPMLKWKKINFLNPLQSLVSRRLAKTAHIVLTNNAKFQVTLSQWLKKMPFCLPNFSTIGEPETVFSLAVRERRIIVFGSSDRHRVYQNSLAKLLEICQILGIEEVYDIGKPLNLKELYEFPDVRFVEMGFLPSEIVSKLLLNSLFCCLDYSRFPGNLGKSTVFAACCAHGAVPLMTEYNPSEANGLEIDQHYLVLDGSVKQFNLEQLQIIADNANKWYNKHNLRENTQIFASCFQDN